MTRRKEKDEKNHYLYGKNWWLCYLNVKKTLGTKKFEKKKKNPPPLPPPKMGMFAEKSQTIATFQLKVKKNPTWW